MPLAVGQYPGVAARRNPGGIALVDAGSGRATTYRELENRSTRVANAFASRLPAGSRVGCWLGTSESYIELYLAIAKAGMTIVPINERYTVAEATHIVQDADVRALVYDVERAEKAHALDIDARVWRVAVGSSSERTNYEDLTLGSSDAALPLVDPNSAFGIVYTSGTTGKPKGAVLTHRAVVATNRSNTVAYRLVPGGAAVYGASMSFTGTVLGQILTHLYTGSTVVMTGTSEPEAVLDACVRFQANFAGMPPPLIPQFAEGLRSTPGGLPFLRTLLQSGGKVSIDVVAELNEQLAGRLVLAWGMTEISGAAAAATTQADMLRAIAGEEWILRSVGRPVPGTEVIATAATGDDDEPSASELWLRTDSLMTEYWHRPEDSGRALADGWYHTGDMGRIDGEGFVSIADRRTDLIVSGGANVYPTEVEDVLRTIPGVIDCAVVGTPHERWGSSVTAVIVATKDTNLSLQMVTEHCSARLAGYKKPTAVLTADELPRTVSGKVQRSQVRALAIAGTYRPAPETSG